MLSFNSTAHSLYPELQIVTDLTAGFCFRKYYFAFLIYNQFMYHK